MEYLLIGSFWVFLAVIAYCWVIRFSTKDYRDERQKMEDFMKETDI